MCNCIISDSDATSNLIKDVLLVCLCSVLLSKGLFRFFEIFLAVNAIHYSLDGQDGD